MDDLKDIVKHLRSVHFVFVLAAAAIIMALSSSNTIYEHALEQLHDVSGLRSVLTEKSVEASISKSANVSRLYLGHENKLEVFVENSLLDYLDALEVHPASIEVSSVFVDLAQADNRSFSEDYEPLSIEKHLCLLSDGENTYSRPRELFISPVYRFGTFGEYRTVIDRLIRSDTLYYAPQFDPAYHRDGTSASKRHKGLPENVREQLNEMTTVSLNVRVTDLRLTDSANRKRFRASQGHLREDPVAYEIYDITFDKLAVRCSGVGRVDSHPTAPVRLSPFEFELPVMFLVKQPTFVSESLQMPTMSKEYYARYFAGVRSFDGLFPELSAVTKNMNSISVEELEDFLDEQRVASDAPISLLGMQISRDLIEIWGVLLMLCVQLYFCIHYRTLVERASSVKEILFPWIGLYRDVVSTGVFQVSIALPFGVSLFLALRGALSHRVVSGQMIALATVAFGLLVWTEAIYVRYRKLTGAKNKSDSPTAL